MTTMLLLLTIHFIADFVLQSDWMAINKSKSWQALFAHTTAYSLMFVPFFGIYFALVTLLTHTAQDYITSRITSRLWQANQRHWFFVAIGADQLLHYFTLAATVWLLG